MTTQLTVGLAQLDSRLGQIEVNLGCHLEWIERAREKGVELLIFPELSLTGYRLLHLTGRVALRRNAPQIERLVQAAGRMSIIVGIVEEDDKGVLYNSSLLIHGGKSTTYIANCICRPTAFSKRGVSLAPETRSSWPRPTTATSGC